MNAKTTNATEDTMSTMTRGDLFIRPSIGGGVVACVLGVKRIGTMTYLDHVDEHGCRGLTPAAGLTRKPMAVTVGDNDREIAALGHAVRIGREEGTVQ